MTPQQLEAMLDDLDDGYEMIFRPLGAAPSPAARDSDPMYRAWSIAEAEATHAYFVWSERRDGDSYAVYRAAADRAGAALHTLAASTAPYAVVV